MAIFEAGVTFSKAHHFGYPAVTFRECTPLGALKKITFIRLAPHYSPPRPIPCDQKAICQQFQWCGSRAFCPLGAIFTASFFDELSQYATWKLQWMMEWVRSILNIPKLHLGYNSFTKFLQHSGINPLLRTWWTMDQNGGYSDQSAWGLKLIDKINHRSKRSGWKDLLIYKYNYITI